MGSHVDFSSEQLYGFIDKRVRPPHKGEKRKALYLTAGVVPLCLQELSERFGSVDCYMLNFFEGVPGYPLYHARALYGWSVIRRHHGDKFYIMLFSYASVECTVS